MKTISTLLAIILLGNYTAFSIDFPGPMPGNTRGEIQSSLLTLENDVIQVVWNTSGGNLKLHSMINKITGNETMFSNSEIFELQFSTLSIKSSEMIISVPAASIENIVPDTTSAKLAHHFGGKSISAVLQAAGNGIYVNWQAVLLDGSNYVRQITTFTNSGADIMVKTYNFLELNMDNAVVTGEVDGSPILAGNHFFGLERPMAKPKTLDVGGNPGLRFELPRYTYMDSGMSLTFSSVMGVFPPEQSRRGYQYYLERERAHPYRPFLHYNSWWDIFDGDRTVQASEFVEVIQHWGDSLKNKRGVTVQSYLADDGWDDWNNSVWDFNSNFPNGFSELKETAKLYGGGVSCWLSPWGGYGARKAARVTYANSIGLETNTNGLSLAGPKYYEHFKNTCLGLFTDYNVNMFKFDGVGSGNLVSGANEYERDIDGLLNVIKELRLANPQLFINTTVGTWPSPYWLFHSDAIWRQGHDSGGHGDGSNRQQWITYRDKETYKNIVQKAPLFPINSLMVAGLQITEKGSPGGYSMDIVDIKAEMRSFFASGTGLQEMYVTASKLTPEAWDILAECADWSNDRQDILDDVHWVGGDPAANEVYGWAAWSHKGAVLSLRNPSASEQSITLDVATVFELPESASGKFLLKSPWKEFANDPVIIVEAGTPYQFTLAPFEVVVFDAEPELLIGNRIFSAGWPYNLCGGQERIFNIMAYYRTDHADIKIVQISGICPIMDCTMLI